MQAKKIQQILESGTQEAIALAYIINHGSTTVRDLLPKMNCPYSVIKGLRDMGIQIEDCQETRTKRIVRHGKEKEVTERYKRYFLYREPKQMRLAV